MDEETVFTIESEGLPVRVRYRPGYLKAMGLAHMEFTSTAQPPKPIPISATGYRSHFCAPEAVALIGTPEAYARVDLVASMCTYLGSPISSSFRFKIRPGN